MKKPGALEWLFFGAVVFYLYTDKRQPTDAASAAGERGIASWYGPGYYGNPTANGETFTARAMTAAHKTLSFNTHVRVTDLDTGKNVVVRINDRGPYVAGRIIDLSEKAAEMLGSKHKGLARARVVRV